MAMDINDLRSSSRLPACFVSWQSCGGLTAKAARRGSKKLPTCRLQKVMMMVRRHVRRTRAEIKESK
jgi:hypothetical protein